MAEETFFQQTDAPPPPPAMPAEPTVDMNVAVEGLSDDLGREADSVGKETFRPPKPEPQEKQAPPEPTQAPLPTAELPPETAQRMAALEQRATQAEFSAQAAAQQRGQFEQMLGAMDQREHERHQAYQMAEALQPPQIADPDALLTDPQAIQGAMQQHAEWGFRRAQAEYAPLINWASQVVAVQPAILNMNQEIAWERAASMAEKEDGIGAEEFEGLRQGAYGVIGSYTQNPSQQQATLLDPVSIKWAALMARSVNGKPRPIQGNAKAPPSPPSSPASASATTSRNSKPQFIKMVEKRFGVQIPTERVAEYKERFGGRR